MTKTSYKKGDRPLAQGILEQGNPDNVSQATETQHQLPVETQEHSGGPHSRRRGTNQCKNFYGLGGRQRKEPGSGQQRIPEPTALKV